MAHRPHRRRGLARARGAHRPGRDPHRRARLARLCARRCGCRARRVRAARAAAKSPSPATRPLAALPRAAVTERLAAALAAHDGLSGAHCIHELWMRGEFAAHIESALEALWGAAAASVPEWLPMRYVEFLPQLYEIALTFRARKSGRSNLYLVLLDFADR